MIHKGSLQPHFLTKTKKEKKKKEKKTLKMFIKCVHILIFNMFGPINSYSRDKVVLSLEIRVQVLDLPCLAHIKVFLISKKKKCRYGMTWLESMLNLLQKDSKINTVWKS